ncbi:MAG: hypothetical protein AB7I50_25415 [Vicinamibacterales bacterium]
MLVGPARAWRKSSAPPPVVEQLFSLDNLEYAGSFRVPSRSDTPNNTFSWSGGCGMSYNPAGNGGAGSLFMSGTDEQSKIAEISIPEPDARDDISISSLPTATLLQSFFDASEGDAEEINPYMPVVGSLVDGSDLYVCYSPFYSNELTAGHVKHSVNGSSSGHGGPYAIDVDYMGVSNKWVVGAMCHVPAHWQARLGGNAIVGSADRSMIQSNSIGPAATSFNIEDLGAVSPVPCHHLLGYYHTPTPPYADGPDYSIFNEASKTDGVFIVNGLASILYVGSFGTGTLTGVEGQKSCYGPNTADPGYIGNPQDHVACYSPIGEDQSFYSYPYRPNIWGYSLEDLADVKSGAKRLDQLTPHLHAEFPLPAHWKPDVSESHYLLACCIDNTSSTKRLFVAHIDAEEFDSPLIHVYNIVVRA